MIKRITLFRAKPGRSMDDIRRWWANHAETAKRLPGVRGYTRNLLVNPLTATIDVTGVAEFWYDSEEAMNKAISTPLFTVDLRKDSEPFIDSLGSYIAEEHVTVPLRQG
ncbi:MAG: EthD domain-containing protein [Chloroflexi bacterium]|nr:EthD domain-containing protein [Chloroflexota bacterium]